MSIGKLSLCRTEVVPDRDATCAEKLAAAGTVLIGKTTIAILAVSKIAPTWLCLVI
jgi:Asp-tRNA(Asn)/Glu-tRNA(Gln) amidotransferase A subunit family amidase